MSPDWAAKPTTVPYAVFGDPQSLNLYAYVRNSPIVRIDADGHTNAIYDTPLGTERSGGEIWSSGGDDRYDVTTTEDEHGYITQTIQQVGSSTFLYDGPPIVSTTLPTTAGAGGTSQTDPCAGKVTAPFDYSRVGNDGKTIRKHIESQHMVLLKNGQGGQLTDPTSGKVLFRESLRHNHITMGLATESRGS